MEAVSAKNTDSQLDWSLQRVFFGIDSRMDKNLETARDEICHDLSSKWLVLNDHVRQQAISLKSHLVGTALNDQASALVQDTEKLCEHFERLHGDIEKLLKLLADEETDMSEDESSPASAEAARQAIQARARDHQENDSLKDVIKALFMWRDDPTSHR